MTVLVKPASMLNPSVGEERLPSVKYLPRFRIEKYSDEEIISWECGMLKWDLSGT
jgi:hypothetical protein